KAKEMVLAGRGASDTDTLACEGNVWRTLYIPSRNHQGSVKVNTPGNPDPAVKKG
ncbi:MAG: hypothetical protein H8E48_11770, partial [Chloroflexi bacterium]|nr:hypothetical protein [Chloroflexota bacterium]